MEGSGDPAGHYAGDLASLSDAQRASFLGGSLAASFARTGDPLAIPQGVTRG